MIKKQSILSATVTLLALTAPQSNTFSQQFTELPHLRVEKDTIHPLSLGFTGRSIIPWFGPDEAPAILIGTHSKYFPVRTNLYRATGNDGSGKAYALPADYPLYEAIPFDEAHLGRAASIGAGHYQTINREDGLFDLIRFKSDAPYYFHNIGEPGAPIFAEPYVIKMAQEMPSNERWIADVNGDEIPDILVGGLTDKSQRFNQYPDWPQEKGPWSGNDHPNMGSLPDTDIQNFRGYDIAGNWMGMPIRKYLWWAKGSLNEKKQLEFGAFRHVRYGQTDYPVQLQDFGTQLSPVVIEDEGQKYIALFTGVDKSMALPLRGEDNGELRTGKSVPLMNDNAPLITVNFANVMGLADMNGDGHEDIIVGSGANGRLTVISGTRIGEFKEIGNIFTKGGRISGDTLSVPIRGDWDNDGYPDIVLGDASGFYSLWRGSADPLVYQSCDFFSTDSGVVRHRPVDGNLQGSNEDGWSYTQPELFDWDGDGYLDLISNDNEAKLFLYRGNGTPHVKERERFMYKGKPLPLAWRSRPAVIDGKFGVAGDDRNCLLFMTWDRKLAYAIPEKNGSLNMEKIVEVTYESGSSIILSGPAGHSGRVKFAIADWDEDGTWDLVCGVQRRLQAYFRYGSTESPSSAPYWFRNVGTNEHPVFDPSRLITFKDGSPIVVNGHEFSAFPTDLNDDGHLDIIFGEDEGFVFYQMRDQLAWDESVDTIKQAMATEARLLKNSQNLPQGQLLFEGWEYPLGSVKEGTLNNGKGWNSPWETNVPKANILEIPLHTIGAFAANKHERFIQISGDGKENGSIRRDLNQPFNLNQDQAVTLVYSIDWEREDSSNNLGYEAITLLNLCNPTGSSLIAIGTTSNEELEISFGNTAQKTTQRLDAVGSWTLRAEIDLTPKGEPTEVRIIVSKDTLPTKIHTNQWQLKANANIEGVVNNLVLSVGKFAGRVSFDNLELSTN
ncbi:VCBS repeat-containing protein [Coraliomargarita sp. SDUM461004]|uniref:VCBS repeat-containing protein n=1 Tax=Thalassobacterium sedimentorum TaxID=3041258 RepID=A0ABU1AFN3_9BACT|nr:VCBS repeat-containing protein [Coraliomargarita sp. SDUM461004]MDQ8192933.1 VCBS repeat-containing protein [Coraliomargarita sp. SDUM461004]